MTRKLTKEEFIEKAKAVHGDFYDYSEVNYINARTKIKIICPEHGEYFQTPYSHFVGCGCNFCARENSSKRFSLGKEEFIKRASNTHNNKYDYSLVDYINGRVKVKIICPEHGIFEQSPRSHLSGSGCPKCANILLSKKKSVSPEEFKKKAIEVHGSKYDYSETNYENSRTKIKIICPIHGTFLQSPHMHLQGHGCPKCRIDKLGKYQTYSQDVFIEKARDVHGDKYDYTKINYNGSWKKIEIICPEPGHGSFWQTPHGHLDGRGCPKCGKIFKKDGKPSSQLQEKLEKMLINRFPSLKCEHTDKSRYPYHCDFYIPERDLFLELNAHWTHQPSSGWYNPKSSSHRELKLELESKFPNWAPFSWYSSDVKKRKTAKKNNLNYVVLWNEQDIEDWFALGCPDGHDGDGMYTWKENLEENQ